MLRTPRQVVGIKVVLGVRRPDVRGGIQAARRATSHDAAI